MSSMLSSMGLDDVLSGYGGGTLPIILDILTSSHISLDLSAHQDALVLAGNLFSGTPKFCLFYVTESGPRRISKFYLNFICILEHFKQMTIVNVD